MVAAVQEQGVVKAVPPNSMKRDSVLTNNALSPQSIKPPDQPRRAWANQSQGRQKC